jgi:hypothetical protein
VNIKPEYQTRDALVYMGRYFLLDQGDFFVHFLGMAKDEVLHEMLDVSRGNWMAMSIQMSGVATGSVTLCIVEMAKVCLLIFITSLNGRICNALIDQ